MNVQAPMSGQVPSQPGPQLPVLSQQNISSLPPQMQSLGAISNMDPEMIGYRKQMRERIAHIFQRRQGSNPEIFLQRLPDIVRRLEEGLYRTATTKEDYLNMETLESRLHSVFRGHPSHNQPLARHSSSSPVSTMIPTPGMSHSNSSNLTVSSSLDNSVIVTSGTGNVESSTVNMGNMAQSANGLTGAGHSGSFTMSDGSLTNGYQQSPANMSIGSSGNSTTPGVPRLSSQMIPTPGLKIQKSMPMNSASTSGGGFSGVDSTIVSQQHQQQHQQQQLQQQKQYLGNQSGRMLHGLGMPMGVGLRASVQQRPSHGLSNGVANSGGLTLIPNNLPLMNGPAASEGYVSANTYGSSPRPLQQHLEHHHHQSIITTASSQLKIPMSGDGYGDVPGAGILYGSATSGSTLNNQSTTSTNLQSKSKNVNFQSVHSAQEHLQSQQQTQTFQQPQSVQPYGQLTQHQQQNQGQQHQLYMLKNDVVRETSLMSGIRGQVISEHGTDTFHESLLRQTPEQFHLSGLHGRYQPNVSDDGHSKVTLGHYSVSQDFLPTFSQGSYQMQQILHPHNRVSQSQNEFSHLSTGSQPETLGQNQWHSQNLHKSQTVDESSFDQHIQEDFHQRIVRQDEAQRPYFSLEGSVTDSAAAATSLTTLQRASGNSLHERQYFNQQRWLLFLHHARWCPAPKGKCQEVNCITVQHLLSHMGSCNEIQCGYPRCRPSKTLINHYRSCQAMDCPVCVPVHVYVSSQRKAAIRPADADRPNAANVLWKNVSVAGADGPVMQSNCVPSVEASEDLQSSLKRRKVEHPSSLMVKSENPPAACSLLDPSHSSQDVQAQVHQQIDMPLSAKPDIVDMKTESSIASRLENPPKFSHVKMDDFEDVYSSRPHSESLLQNEPDGCHKTESMQINGDIDQTAVEVKEESNAHTSDSVAGSKSGKPKIKGVSLTELFTPEQIREHIVSLRQWVGQSKAKAEKNQAMERSMNENSCQLCAVEKLTFEPPPIYCSLCGARIKRNASYYTIGTGDTRHYFCIPCYNEARGDSIEVEGTLYLKARLEKKKNDEETEEWWVQCDKCEAWQHQICALFNGRRNDGGQAEYTCANCHVQEIERGERMPLPQSAVLGAKDLPRTILSDHIEQRLFRRLKQERQERARHLGKPVDEVPGAEALVVRVVSSVDKKLDVKQRFLEIFQEENYPTEFPYKSKVILLFQKIEGVEVCLFGMYVQEFGSECHFPNQRRVYLSYLDSVKYFRPEIKTITGEALRTFVYHEILIGYLEYCKKRGFTSCYIWACPPLKGEDYILYCHPEIQKTPKSDKLREWYLSMLRKATKENIVVDLTNLYDHFFVQLGECKAKVTAARLPYFDGDYWPGAAEDLINQLQQEEDGRKQQKKGKTKKTITKRALKAAGQSDLSGNASKDALLMRKLGETILPMKEDFIMVHLQHACNHCCILMVSGARWVCNQCKNFQLCDKCYDAEQKLEEKERHAVHAREEHLLSPVEIHDVPSDTKDKDEILESEFFDTRQAFLSLCQGNHYQYDTLRRAKHSSMMVLYHLHNPTAPAFVITCNICHRDIETGQGWRCEICPDFDVCNDCYQRDGGVNHPHRLTNHPSTADRDAQNKEARQKRVLQLRKMLDLLVHASQCRSLHCQYPNCRKVKGLFRHGINCKTRASGGCVLCKKMWYLLQLHARACKESGCHVPRCRDLREHLRRLQQQSDSRRRAAVMEMMRQRAAEVAGNTG